MTRSIVAIAGARSRFRWAAVRRTLASTCWLSAGRRVRLPPETFRMTSAGRMACSARQLVASTDGCHRKANTAAREREDALGAPPKTGTSDPSKRDLLELQSRVCLEAEPTRIAVR